jgi:hypothetical protein
MPTSGEYSPPGDSKGAFALPQAPNEGRHLPVGKRRVMELAIATNAKLSRDTGAGASLVTKLTRDR